MRNNLEPTINRTAADGWLLALRIGIASLMLTHGLPKLFKMLDGDFAFGDPLGIGSGPSLVLAVFAEVVCSLLVLLGIFTRLATIPLMVTMLVAVLFVHASDPFAQKELPLLYFLIYATLFFLGPGRFALTGGRRNDLTADTPATEPDRGPDNRTAAGRRVG